MDGDGGRINLGFGWRVRRRRTWFLLLEVDLID